MATEYFMMQAVGFRDAEGIIRSGLIREFNDIVCLEGYGEDDEVLVFDDAAYHLQDWCERHGLAYYEAEPFEIEVELEEQ